MNSNRLKILFGTALFLTVSAGVPHKAAGDFFLNEKLNRQVERGRLAVEVQRRIAAKGRSEVLVMIEDDTGLAPAIHEKLSEEKPGERLRKRSQILSGKKLSLMSFLREKDVAELTSYSNFPVMHLEVDGPALAALLDQPGILSAGENRAVRHFLTQSLPLIHAPSVHAGGSKGSGTAVAVLDTGVNYTLETFGSCTSPGVPASCKVAYAQDFAPSDGSLDDHGHGTNVSGIVLGVAPETAIIGLDVFRTDGYAYYSDLLSALDWVVDNRETYNIVAVNMSLGGGSFSAPCASDYLADAISTLRGAGVLSVIASGNEALTGSISAPACIPGAVSVGAVYDSNIGQLSSSVCTDPTTAADQVTCFTNMADFLSILAPGAWVTAAGYTAAGTSQATPHVSGSVAVLKGAHPSLSADDVAGRLTGSGDSITTTRNSATYVKPRVNLENAMAYQQISVSQSALEFGTVETGSVSPAQTVTITNSGSASLIMGNISLSGTSADQFSLKTDGCSAAALDPAESCAVAVEFRPTSSGSKTAALIIPSNDPDYPQKTIALSGTGSMSYLLTLTRTGSGSGTVSSQPAAVDCGPACTAFFAQGTSVELTPAPAADSLFSGWSGDCTGTGSCRTLMTSAREIAATFTLKPPVMINPSQPVYYYTLSDVYAAAGDGAAVRLQAVSFAESLDFNRNVAVSLAGGYDSSYSLDGGMTVLNGSLTISAGTVSVANIIIR